MEIEIGRHSLLRESLEGNSALLFLVSFLSLQKKHVASADTLRSQQYLARRWYWFQRIPSQFQTIVNLEQDGFNYLFNFFINKSMKLMYRKPTELSFGSGGWHCQTLFFQEKFIRYTYIFIIIIKSLQI